MQVTASHKYLRIAPRKVRLVTDLVRGMDYGRAKVELDHLPKRSAHHVNKLLESAASNAFSNHGLVKDNLFIKEIKVDDGPTLKRYKPKGFGSAMPIAKRTSHITLVLDERVPGLKAEDPDRANASQSEATSDGTSAPKNETTAAPAQDSTDAQQTTEKGEQEDMNKQEPKKAARELGKKQEKGFFKKVFQRQKNV